MDHAQAFLETSRVPSQKNGTAWRRVWGVGAVMTGLAEKVELVGLVKPAGMAARTRPSSQGGVNLIGACEARSGKGGDKVRNI